MRGRTAYAIHGQACGRAGAGAEGGGGVVVLKGSPWRLGFVVVVLFCQLASGGGGGFGGRGAHGSLDLVEIYEMPSWTFV